MILGSSTRFADRRAHRLMSQMCRFRFAQSIVTALSVFIAAGLLALVFGWNWRVPVVVLALAVALAWLSRLRLADALLWEVEILTGRDLNHDGAVGQPGQAVLVNAWQARQEVAQVMADDDAEHESPRADGVPTSVLYGGHLRTCAWCQGRVRLRSGRLLRAP